MNIVITGHVDHGKSTVIGRLLADTFSLPEGKMEQLRSMCEKNSKPFEYAFLLDALKDEQSQGITIDSARVFFKTEKRDYIIIDAPGHIEFLKNMVSGAARAEAALLVIDANEGIQENSRRHGYMLSMLGINQVVVLINKMDLVGYHRELFDKIAAQYDKFLFEIGIKANAFIPVSGMGGDNIAGNSKNMSWYKGCNVLNALDNFFKMESLINSPFRFPVQDVYKFTNYGDDRRIIAGTVESGSVSVGEELVFYPSGKKSTVKSIEGFNQEVRTSAAAGYSIGLTLSEQLYVTRGEIAVRSNEPPCMVGKILKVSLFWLGKNPFVKRKEYQFKLGTSKTAVKLEEIIRVINTSDLTSSANNTQINKLEVAECIIRLNRAVAFDNVGELVPTARFVIVDGYEISGGGIIRDVLEDRLSKMRDDVIVRNLKWEKSIIPPPIRAEKYNQKASMILLTGPVKAGKKEVARMLEAELFELGKIVYFLGIGNVKYGVDADIKNIDRSREEHLRRLAEVAHIMLDAGVILIVTARELSQENLEILKTVIDPDRIDTVWVGNEITTDIAYDYIIPGISDIEESVIQIITAMQNKNIISTRGK